MFQNFVSECQNYASTSVLSKNNVYHRQFLFTTKTKLIIELWELKKLA